MRTLRPLIVAAALAVGAASAGPASAIAQPPAALLAQAPGPLPTAPSAERAKQGIPSEAPGSLPGGRGLSPLEPYLVTWLLPVAGLISVIVAVFVDRRTRASAR